MLSPQADSKHFEIVMSVLNYRLHLGEAYAERSLDMLNKAGFETGKVSVAAILGYGNTSDTSAGNLSFLKGGADVLAQRATAGIIPNVLETKKIPLAATSTGSPQTTAPEISASTRNFYDAAVAMSAQVNSTQLKQLIDLVARQVNSTDYQTIEKQLAKSYIDSLQMKQSIESLDTLLG